MSFSLDTYQLILTDSTEVQVYILLNGMNTKLWETTKAVEKNLLPVTPSLERDIADIRDMIQLGIAETVRFGVISPLVLDEQLEQTETAQIYTPSQEYWNWYTFWDKWKNALTAEHWSEFDSAMDNDLPLPHLPTSSWLDS